MIPFDITVITMPFDWQNQKKQVSACGDRTQRNTSASLNIHLPITSSRNQFRVLKELNTVKDNMMILRVLRNSVRIHTW